MYYDLCNSSFLFEDGRNLTETCKGISYKYIIESHWTVLSNHSTIFDQCDGPECIKLNL
jgi:hypothetical protein